MLGAGSVWPGKPIDPEEHWGEDPDPRRSHRRGFVFSTVSQQGLPKDDWIPFVVSLSNHNGIHRAVSL
jgi:hypothetical protein